MPYNSTQFNHSNTLSRSFLFSHLAITKQNGWTVDDPVLKKYFTKNNFKNIRFEVGYNFESYGISTSMLPDPRGYPLLPEGLLVYFCPSISASPNFEKRYSNWAWDTIKSRKENGRHTVNKKCLGIYVCKNNTSCTSAGFRPIQNAKRSQKTRM